MTFKPQCNLLFFINDRYSFPGDAFRFRGNDGLFAVVEEAYGGFSFFVELDLRHPKQCTPVVFGVRQRLAAVIGAVEVFADGIASQDVMPVAVSPLIPVVGEEAVVYDDFGLVVLCVPPTALFAWGIVGVDIDFIKVTEPAVFFEILFGNTEIGVGLFSS